MQVVISVKCRMSIRNIWFFFSSSRKCLEIFSFEILDCRSAFKEKDDVYGFGVILLETIVGRKMMTANDIDVSKDIV